jgi:phosphoesterase RecJ-like protein
MARENRKRTNSAFSTTTLFKLGRLLDLYSAAAFTLALCKRFSTLRQLRGSPVDPHSSFALHSIPMPAVQLKNTNWGKTNIVQPEAVSSTAVLYDIFKQNNIQYDKETAMALLTGLATDTGFFVFINTGGPFQIAGDLIDSHALDYQKIIFNIMRQMNIEDVVFVGNALSKMIVDYEKKVAIIPMPFESDLHYEKLAQSSYLLTNYLQSINGTEFGIMVIEEKKGTFRVQFRSRNREFDVGALAFSLGGGGHKNAAGATIQAESIDEAIKKILGTL